MGFTLTLPEHINLWDLTGSLGEEDIPHRWVLGSRFGVHCPDCLDLAGEVRTLGEWMNTIMPGAGSLHCSSGCRCRLEPVIDLPTNFTLCVPSGINAWIDRVRLIRDASLNWRINFSGNQTPIRPAAVPPARSPAASLPSTTASARRLWWDGPETTPRRKPVRGVD